MSEPAARQPLLRKRRPAAEGWYCSWRTACGRSPELLGSTEEGERPWGRRASISGARGACGRAAPDPNDRNNYPVLRVTRSTAPVPVTDRVLTRTSPNVLSLVGTRPGSPTLTNQRPCATSQRDATGGLSPCYHLARMSTGPAEPRCFSCQTVRDCSGRTEPLGELTARRRSRLSGSRPRAAAEGNGHSQEYAAIEPGRRADLILFDGDQMTRPLDRLGRKTNIKDGVIVGETKR